MQRESFAERFRRERDILASLDHPNIASLHDAGVASSGQPWLALEYVEGEPITRWCDRKLLSVEPESKELKETELTRASGRPLTPEYASPEQLANRPLTVASDVYSLGVVLYELLVGVRPHGGESWSVGKLEMAVLDSDAVAPSRRVILDEVAASRRSDTVRLPKSLRPDLDAILLKSLNKSTAERYESVGGFRADLERWARHEPVSAVVPGLVYRLTTFGRRHRVGVAVGGLVTAFLISATVVVGVQSIRAQQEASRALAAKDFLLDMFRMTDPSQTHGTDVSATHLLDGALERARTTLASPPRLRVEVLRGIAEINQHLGRYGHAGPILLEAATILADLAERRELTATQVELADNALRMGDSKTAAAFLSQAEHGLREFQSDQPLQSRGHETQGWLLRSQGDFGGAKVHMLAFQESAAAAYGRRDNRTADALRGVAEVEAGLHDYEGAIRHIEEARAIASVSNNANVADLVGIEVERAQIEIQSRQVG